MRSREQRLRSSPIYKIKVKGGDWVDISLVVLVYRCEECHSKLRRKDAGVVCCENPDHKHFIHRNEVAQIEAKEADDLKQAQEDYATQNGELVYTGEFKL